MTGEPPAEAPPTATDGELEMSWLRAIGWSLAVLVVGFGGGVYGANRILTKALGLTRTAREWLAIGLFFVVVIGLAWALRRLQDRRLI